MRTQLLGLCRFSYLGGRGFQVRHESIEERRAFLYDPARLARRWAWFEQVALPGLTGQTDPDHTLVIMTGPDLPQPWLARLREITAACGVTPADAIAVGDGANDLGMLQLAGAGVALHAKPVVAAQAPIRINHGDLTALLYLQGYGADEFVAD